MSQIKKVSTTQLAKLLQLPSKMVFQLLSERKWIEREGTSWRLTGKGEFEGGEYKQSDKYGQYIVWPESITEHRIFSDQSNLLLSATRIAEPLGLSARTINAVLSEMGWIQAQAGGWQTTNIGQTMGGENHENSQNGTCYVLWPKSIVANPQFEYTINQLNLKTLDKTKGLGGYTYSSSALQYIANWLYIMGFNHAFWRPLPKVMDGQSELVSDFYLPQHGIYIEYWGEEQNAEAIKQKLEKQQYYNDLDLHFIEINEGDLDRLEDVLSKALLKLGVQLYK